MTQREMLHRLVDKFSDAAVQAALTCFTREREAVERWPADEIAAPVPDGWALANAREAIREEPW